jgi:hypothetical protein
VNTNEKHRQSGESDIAIYGRDIVATFGNYEEYGSPLENLSVDDVVFSYQKETGVRAKGLVVDTFDGQAVNKRDQLFPDSEENEYHVPVRWQQVLEPSNAITPKEVRDIVGRPIYGVGTHCVMSESDNPEALMSEIEKRS